MANSDFEVDADVSVDSPITPSGNGACRRRRVFARSQKGWSSSSASTADGDRVNIAAKRIFFIVLRSLSKLTGARKTSTSW